jgi:hypothetical protein
MCSDHNTISNCTTCNRVAFDQTHKQSTNNPQTHKPTNPQTHKPTNPQTHKPTNPQTHKPLVMTNSDRSSRLVSRSEMIFLAYACAPATSRSIRILFKHVCTRILTIRQLSRRTVCDQHRFGLVVLGSLRARHFKSLNSILTYHNALGVELVVLVGIGPQQTGVSLLVHQ